VDDQFEIPTETTPVKFAGPATKNAKRMTPQPVGFTWDNMDYKTRKTIAFLCGQRSPTDCPGVVGSGA
jgi:hypothetical protein